LHHLLGGDVVVPKIGSVGFDLEVGNFFFLRVEVKDTPEEA